ncbi:uncharacterized protein LOC126375077 [Pectinophora gossypiella]|uniref:uncharacterized protein LOC126375077 n=1 Tax=Pectinophora gossypiella TaxID=13191 RepID=UPI00214EF98A|nr:uncharacterized protein LOC126375077 [Pectinophora gossypiella]
MVTRRHSKRKAPRCCLATPRHSTWGSARYTSAAAVLQRAGQSPLLPCHSAPGSALLASHTAPIPFSAAWPQRAGPSSLLSRHSTHRALFCCLATARAGLCAAVSPRHAPDSALLSPHGTRRVVRCCLATARRSLCTAATLQRAGPSSLLSRHSTHRALRCCLAKARAGLCAARHGTRRALRCSLATARAGLCAAASPQRACPSPQLPRLNAPAPLHCCHDTALGSHFTSASPQHAGLLFRHSAPVPLRCCFETVHRSFYLVKQVPRVRAVSPRHFEPAKSLRRFPVLLLAANSFAFYQSCCRGGSSMLQRPSVQSPLLS